MHRLTFTAVILFVEAWTAFSRTETGIRRRALGAYLGVAQRDTRGPPETLSLKSVILIAFSAGRSEALRTAGWPDPEDYFRERGLPICQRIPVDPFP